MMNKQLSEEYIKHHIFAELTELCDCYESLSFNSFRFISQGISSVFGIDHIIFASLKGTINSINITLKEGYINDAYALVRKYHEGVILDIYKNVYLKNNYNPMESLYVERVNKWFKGEKSFPQYKDMIQYLQQAIELKDIRNYYDITKDGAYGAIKNICNANLHYNKLAYMLLNNPDYCVSNREKHLDYICKSIMHICEFHWACLFVLSPAYMTSSDYIDSLDCGCTPVEDSQYWIAKFAEDMYNKLWGNKADIAQYIKTTSGLIFSNEI